MKSNQLLRNALAVATAVVVSTLLFLVSCKKDDVQPNKPAPTLTVGTGSASSTAGSVVTSTVHADSPEGGKLLKILVNGAADSSLPDVTLDGSAAQDVPISFTIPASAAVGMVYTITFQASDKKDQLSSIGVFVVTVSAVPAKEIVDVPAGNITADTHWTADKIYRLNGFVRVGKDEHTGAGVAPVIANTATLTIDAGTVIYGKTGTPGGTLVVQRGSKIVAIGTASNPIVFTSEKAIGSRNAGDWGGVVICGKSANNVLTSTSTGTAGIEELEGAYGGFHGGGASPDLADNSGTLQYVRIEFAGYPINPNQEINGITFGSVGSGTTVDHVQVTYSNDDSFEWFGGTMNAKNLIAYKGIDDDFDTDNGFSGHVQFGLAIRDAGIADQSGSNGFESDNDANGTANTPITAAEFSNMTIIGGKATSGKTINLQFQNGAQLRRNTQQKIINSFITAFPNGVFIDKGLGDAIGNATAGTLVLKNNILAGVEGWGGNGFGSAATAAEQTALGLSAAGANHANNPRGMLVAGGTGSFTNGVFGYTGSGELAISAQVPVTWFASMNTILQKWTTSGINLNIFEPEDGTPTLLPTAASPLTSGADFTGFSNPFFTSVTYRGAFGTTDWTTGGWVNWNPQITDYTH